MIIRFDSNTLGCRINNKSEDVTGKVVNTTIVFVQCDECKTKEWKTTWNNRKNREHDYCQSCKNTLGISGFKGKHHSKKMRDDMSKRISGDNNPSKRPEVKEKISQKLKGRKTPWLTGKKRPEHSKAMSKLMKRVWNNDNTEYDDYRNLLEKGLKNSRKKLQLGHSQLHTNIKEFLIKNGFKNFVSEEEIKGFSGVVDEVDIHNKIILEINGDFWHCNPQVFTNPNEKVKFPGRTLTVQEVWDNDRRRINRLKKLGYAVIIIWESEFKNAKDEILKTIKQIYKNGK